jgi:Toxin co-regulated pilus biosynthesis protein Q
MKPTFSIRWPRANPLHLLLVGIAITPLLAKADYTVINDDLYPETMIQATRQARMAPQRVAVGIVPQRYTIPFVRGVSRLTNYGSDTLAMLLPKLHGASIRIVGRPDAIIYATGELSRMPRARAENIRAYLVRLGVPTNKIAIEIDNTPNPQAAGNGYPCDIYITYAEERAAASFAAASRYDNKELTKEEAIEQAAQRPTMRPTHTAAHAESAYAAVTPQPTPATVLINQAAPTGNNKRLVQYINQAVESGHMSPQVALNLLRGLIDAENSTPTAAATPAARKESWLLDKNLTLRDNMEVWSKKSGWKTVIWEAANFYQITTSASIEGDFPEILRKIAESTGLNICANTGEKSIRVTDAALACK